MLVLIIILGLLGVFVLWILALICRKHPSFSKILMFASNIAMFIYSISSLSQFKNSKNFNGLIPLCVFTLLSTAFMVFTFSEGFLEEEFDGYETSVTITEGIFSDTVTGTTREVTKGFTAKLFEFLAAFAIVYFVLFIINVKVLLIGGIIVSCAGLVWFLYTLIKFLCKKFGKDRSYY